MKVILSKKTSLSILFKKGRTMTVKELIEKLNTFDQDMIVLVNGYEGGLSDISKIEATKVNLNVNKEDYLGPHEESPKGSTSAVYISRNLFQ